MPSGFQQDSNQLQPTYFRVVMDMTDGDVYSSNGSNAGAVQPFTWDNYTGNGLPHTAGSANVLAQGNIRFQRIIEELTKYDDAQILDLEATTGSNPPDGEYQVNHLAFTVKYERFAIDNDEGNANSPLVAMERQYLRSINNGNTSSPYDGENINNTTEAVQEAIMRALIETVTRSVRVFVPVEGSDPIVGEGVQRYITASDVTNNEDNCDYGQLRSTITVNGPLDGTTVISTDSDAA